MNYETDLLHFDNSGFMSPYGENGVLFTAEYIVLRDNLRNDKVSLETVGVQAIETTLAPSDRDKLSHDNMTAIVCLSHFLGLSYHRKYFHREWWWRAHPRDIFFYLYMKGGISRFFSLFGIWFTILDGLFTCFHWKRNKDGSLDTDGKLLVWLKFKSLKLHRLEKLCTFLLKKGNNCGWITIFGIYFRQDRSNPILRLAEITYAER